MCVGGEGLLVFFLDCGEGEGGGEGRGVDTARPANTLTK